MICVEIVILITARIRRILKIMALNMYIRWKKEKMAKSALKGMSFYTTDHLSPVSYTHLTLPTILRV